MGDESIGFSAKAPVSAWDKQIGVDYPGVFKALLKAALAAATANAPGAISAAIDSFFAFKVEDAKRPPEQLAWLLTRRALARAMAELTVEAARRHGAPLEDKDGLVAALDRALDGAEIWIDPSFFDRPADHSVVDAVRPQFREWLVNLGLKDAEAESVNHRLGAYFTFALRREWSEHAEAYRPLEAEFQRYENRFAKADARERAWIRNADYLQRLIQEPVFDETFGLAQIYVPLRAWYLEEPGSRKSRGREEEDECERRRVVDLEQHLDAWFRSTDKKDAIRVICGGPGSGKTSFAKIWAAKLAQEGHHVLFVPLHRLELRDERPDVQAALWEFLRDLDVLPVDPLDSRDGETCLLILFDGLDELAMQGRAGQEVARNFVEAVERKLDLLNERQNRTIKVAFGGRDIAVQSARLPSHQVLHVLPYHGAEDELEDPQKLLEADRYGCQRWWQQFGEAVGENYRGVPDELQHDDLKEITAQPLLNYLLALSFRRGELEFSAAPNLNLIYRDLLSAVYERPWGPGHHPTQKQLAREEFDELLAELGLAAWHGAGRTVTEAEVEEACKRAGLQEQLAAFQEGARLGAISLLAAFYFRQAGKIEGERTFEFTHKSFGEYLVARRLVRAIEHIHDERERNRRSRQCGKTIEEALIRWIELTGPTPLDSDLLAFLIGEVALGDKKLVTSWQDCFRELLSDQLGAGLPMHRLGLPTYQEMTRRARNAEEALLAAHFCCARVTAEASPIRWPSPLALRDLITRLEQGYLTAVTRDCLGWLGSTEGSEPHSLSLANLVLANLDGADLRGADLEEANLERVNLGGANLEGADFEDANLKGANLGGANLEGASLVLANLEGANLEGAKLRVAKLVAANLGKANLLKASLVEADLRGAYLRGAYLRGAYLKGANLQRADLREADLREAEFQGAYLLEANLLESTLMEATFGWTTIERKWVESMALDAEKLGIQVVDDVHTDLAGEPG